MDREDIKTLVKKWWEIYEDESLDYKNIISEAAMSDHAKLGSLIAEQLQADDNDVSHHRRAPSAA